MASLRSIDRSVALDFPGIISDVLGMLQAAHHLLVIFRVCPIAGA
jgi:hypothetical protein